MRRKIIHLVEVWVVASPMAGKVVEDVFVVLAQRWRGGIVVLLAHQRVRLTPLCRSSKTARRLRVLGAGHWIVYLWDLRLRGVVWVVR